MKLETQYCIVYYLLSSKFDIIGMKTVTVLVFTIFFLLEKSFDSQYDGCHVIFLTNSKISVNEPFSNIEK